MTNQQENERTASMRLALLGMLVSGAILAVGAFRFGPDLARSPGTGVTATFLLPDATGSCDGCHLR